MRELNGIVEYNGAVSVKNLVVVDFYADWCGPCKELGKFLETFHLNFPNVDFYKVDITKNSELAEQCEVSALPTVNLYKNGAFLGAIVGLNVNELETQILKLSS